MPLSQDQMFQMIQEKYADASQKVLRPVGDASNPITPEKAANSLVISEGTSLRPGITYNQQEFLLRNRKH